MKEKGEPSSPVPNARSQSAMEYLMTYGWAILIIAVVLGALYSLGVFNAVNFMPKVPGGGCHVFRPNGPGTSWSVNLVGSCNNALPQYVAQFNGQSSYVGVRPEDADLYGENTLTINAWVNPSAFQQDADMSTIVTKAQEYYFQLGGSGNLEAYLPGVNSAYFGSSNTVQLNVWSEVTFTYDGSYERFYINGVLSNSQGASSTIGGISSYWLGIGANLGQTGYLYGGTSNRRFNGGIANVQIYNTSLTAGQVQYLYNEGIGGVPISPQYLVGWWPLNGDTNDYSGNNNNGAATAITFNGTWTGGYTPP